MKLLVGAVRNEPWLQALLLMLGLVAVFLLTHSGTDSSEAVYHYSVAEQIVKHGELGFSSPQQGVYAVAPNGRTYASHEIGNSLLLLPVAWVNSRLERRLTPAIGAERVKMITRFLIGSMGATSVCTPFETVLFELIGCRSDLISSRLRPGPLPWTKLKGSSWS